MYVWDHVGYPLINNLANSKPWRIKNMIKMMIYTFEEPKGICGIYWRDEAELASFSPTTMVDHVTYKH